jgi:hypothetical protein
MASAWAERAKVARLLSNIPDAENLFTLSDCTSDYARKITDFRELVGIDKRTIAVGIDNEYVTYDALQNVTDEYSNILWLSITLNMLWQDFCTVNRNDDSPLKVLSFVTVPSDLYIKQFADPAYDIHLLNNIELHYFEKFYASDIYDGRYGNLNYSAVDVQDLLSGNYENYFDFVRTNEYITVKPTMDILEAQLNSVKVGGMFVFWNASDGGEIYVDATRMFTSHHVDICRYIKSRSDFISSCAL